MQCSGVKSLSWTSLTSSVASTSLIQGDSTFTKQPPGYKFHSRKSAFWKAVEDILVTTQLGSIIAHLYFSPPICLLLYEVKLTQTPSIFQLSHCWDKITNLQHLKKEIFYLVHGVSGYSPWSVDSKAEHCGVAAEAAQLVVARKQSTRRSPSERYTPPVTFLLCLPFPSNSVLIQSPGFFVGDSNRLAHPQALYM